MPIWPEAHSLFAHMLSGEIGLGGAHYAGAGVPFWGNCIAAKTEAV